MYVLLTLLVGCGGPPTQDPVCLETPRQCHDRDKDGFELREDCDDTEAAVNPAAEEVWYDGLDNDCDPETLDYELDADADGFPEGNDCDDENAAVNPGRPEIPYDGLDNDCDETTPDNDLDGDGYPTPEDCEDKSAAISPAATEVPYDDIDNDCDPTTPDDDLDGDGVGVELDCDDEDAARSPDNDEVPYNGIDDDCSAATVDDDLDGDGYLLATDCNDDDPDTHPFAIEVFGDGEDNDCDGVTDAVPLQYAAAAGLAWEAPTEPVLTSDGQNFLIGVGARAFDDGTSEVRDVGIALTFDAGTYGSLLNDPIRFKYELQAYPIDGVIDVAAEANAFYASASWFKSSGGLNHVGLTQLSFDLGSVSYEATELFHAHAGPGSIAYSAADIDVQVAGDTRWALACGDDHLHAFTADDAFGSHQIARSSNAYEPGGHTCVLDLTGGTPQAHVCSSTDCVTWDLDVGGDGFTVASSQPWDGYRVRDVDHHDGWTVIVWEAGGISARNPLLSLDLVPGRSIASADVSYWSGTLYVIFVEEDGDVFLTWGDPAAPTGWPEVQLDFADPPRQLRAEEAAIHALGGRLGYAVTGVDELGGADPVAWAFMGL